MKRCFERVALFLSFALQGAGGGISENDWKRERRPFLIESVLSFAQCSVHYVSLIDIHLSHPVCML